MMANQFDVAGLRLCWNDRNLDLVSIADAAGVRLDQRPDGAPVWQLHAVDAAGRRIDLTGRNAAEARARMDGDSVVLAWRGVQDAATGAGPFDVEVTIRPHAWRSGAWRR